MKPEIPSSDSVPLSPSSPVGATGRGERKQAEQTPEQAQTLGEIGTGGGGDAGGKGSPSASFDGTLPPDGHSPTPDQWRDMLISGVRALMDHDLTVTEIRAAWLVLDWSFGCGRESTGRVPASAVELRTGMGRSQSYNALRNLCRKGIIRCSAEGNGWQFMPPGKLHIWRVPRRVWNEALQELADKLDAAHHSQSDRSKDAVSLEAAIDEAVRRRRIFCGEGVLESKTAQPADPLKAFPPSSDKEPLTTFNTLKGKPVLDPSPPTLATPFEGNSEEASMDWEEDRMSIDEAVLMRRLTQEIGKEGRMGMDEKGGLWRMFIRGSADVANDPSTAEAVRDALNELRFKKQKGEVIRSAFGYLWKHSRAFAAAKGWIWDENGHAWKQVKPFNLWKYEQAAKKRRR